MLWTRSTASVSTSQTLPIANSSNVEQGLPSTGDAVLNASETLSITSTGNLEQELTSTCDTVLYDEGKVT